MYTFLKWHKKYLLLLNGMFPSFHTSGVLKILELSSTQGYFDQTAAPEGREELTLERLEDFALVSNTYVGKNCSVNEPWTGSFSTSRPRERMFETARFSVCFCLEHNALCKSTDRSTKRARVLRTPGWGDQMVCGLVVHCS